MPLLCHGYATAKAKAPSKVEAKAEAKAKAKAPSKAKAKAPSKAEAKAAAASQDKRCKNYSHNNDMILIMRMNQSNHQSIAQAVPPSRR